MSDYAVFVDANRHSCIRVKIGHKHTAYIPMSATELAVKQMTNAEFDKIFTELSDYDPKRAAAAYLFDRDNVKREVTSEARAHLERLANPPHKRERLADEDPAPKPPLQPKKEATMASKKTEAAEAPAKRKPAAKTEAPAAPAKKTAAAKKSTPAKKAPTASAGGRRLFTEDGVITVTHKGENPKRGTAADRYDLYRSGMTVSAYLAAGGQRRDVVWDQKMGWITVKG